MSSTPTPLPGFRVFYPDQCALRNHLFSLWKQSARCFGFFEYDSPILESLELFTQKSGPEIAAQLFTFADQGDRDVALRPEMTPSLARMVGSRVNSLRRPIKWFNIGEHFRYEKPQKGRTRSFYQFNADIFGEAGTGADAELIALCIHSLKILGLDASDFRIHLSDRILWMYYLFSFGLEGEAAQAVLSVIDKCGRLSPEQIEAHLSPHLGTETALFLKQINTLTAIDSIESLQAFFADISVSEREILDKRLEEWQTLLSELKAMGLDDFLQIDLSIVRGLSYYTGFVFEAFAVKHSPPRPCRRRSLRSSLKKTGLSGFAGLWICHWRCHSDPFARSHPTPASVHGFPRYLSYYQRSGGAAGCFG